MKFACIIRPELTEQYHRLSLELVFTINNGKASTKLDASACLDATAQVAL